MENIIEDFNRKLSLYNESYMLNKQKFHRLKRLLKTYEKIENPVPREINFIHIIKEELDLIWEKYCIDRSNIYGIKRLIDKEIREKELLSSIVYTLPENVTDDLPYLKLIYAYKIFNSGSAKCPKCAIEFSPLFRANKNVVYCSNCSYRTSLIYDTPFYCNVNVPLYIWVEIIKKLFTFPKYSIREIKETYLLNYKVTQRYLCNFKKWVLFTHRQHRNLSLYLKIDKLFRTLPPLKS